MMLRLFAALVLITGLSGCATVEGMGRDISAGAARTAELFN